MQNSFLSWMKDNEELFSFLKDNNSRIYDRMSDLIKSLKHIASLNEKDIDPDLEVIYDEGFAYINDRISIINSFLNDEFMNDKNLFMKYEPILYYYIYLEDIYDAILRAELDIDLYKEKFNPLENEIMDIMTSRKEFDDNEVDRFNMIIESILPINDDLLTVPEIFSRIFEELMIEAGKEGRPFRD